MNLKKILKWILVGFFPLWVVMFGIWGCFMAGMSAEKWSDLSASLVAFALCGPFWGWLLWLGECWFRIKQDEI